jgi:SAM-dependent methyltransferase
MPGEMLDFPDASFDAILCMSSYHHMDLEQAASEFARVLRPRGMVVMVEPLASNPPAWIYRKLIRPSHRDVTSEETPIRVCDLRYLRSHFTSVEWRGLFLTSLIPFAIDRIFGTNSFTRWMFRLTSRLDEFLLRFFPNKLAWKMHIVATSPLENAHRRHKP